MLARRPPSEVRATSRRAVDAATLAQAAALMAEVEAGGFDAVLRLAQRFGDLGPGEDAVYDRAALRRALDRCDAPTRALLERAADRIAAFARAQRAALTDLSVPVSGGMAGHEVVPVERAGCYAPGGRFPLPSSVLMTAVTARTAGVRDVWVASPRPAAATLAAAAVADADALLAVGGVQAIAAFAFGTAPAPACDVIVGPGNRWVTAAKQLAAGQAGIDMLAGPSELVVLADDSADPATVAADLLAQAEHDPDALPALVTLHEPLIDAVNAELAAQLTLLPTRATAEAALRNGFAVAARDLAEAAAVCDALAPEHLELSLRNPEAARPLLRHYGALFVGHLSAEVLGDYGAGPNHVLPTGGTARRIGGLSVFTFLRVRTWLALTDPAAAQTVVNDAEALALTEGLYGHARSAAQRKGVVI